MKRTSILIFFGAFLIFIVFWLSYDTSQEKPGEENSATTLRGIDIARNMFTFLDKTIRPDGGFYFAYECGKNMEETCDSKEFYATGHSAYVPPPHFGHLILAFYDFGKKTGEDAYIKKADTAMEYVLVACAKDDEWCLWNFSPLSVYFNETKDARYKNAMLKVAGDLTRERPLAQQLLLNSGLKLRTLHIITGDKKYLSLLTKQADEMIAGKLDDALINPVLYKEGDFEVRALTFKMLWATILPAFQETKNQKYLDFLKDSLIKANLTAHLGSLKDSSDLQAASFVLETLFQLAILDQASKDEHLKQAHEIAQYIYSHYADTPNNKKFNGDYGFYEGNMKDSLNNGWLARDYVRLADDLFSSN